MKTQRIFLIVLLSSILLATVLFWWVQASEVSPTTAGASAEGDSAPAVEAAATTERERYQQAYRSVDAAAKKHGIDPELAHAIALHGSYYNPQKVSSEGAIGLLLVRPTIAAAYGITDQTRLFNPEINADIALRHLKSLLARHDLQAAIFAYTTGRKPAMDESDGAGEAQEVSSLAQRILQQYALNGGG